MRRTRAAKRLLYLLAERSISASAPPRLRLHVGCRQRERTRIAAYTDYCVALGACAAAIAVPAPLVGRGIGALARCGARKLDHAQNAHPRRSDKAGATSKWGPTVSNATVVLDDDKILMIARGRGVTSSIPYPDLHKPRRDHY